MIETGYNQETIKNAIHTKWAGKTVHFAEITESTNLWAKEFAQGLSERSLENLSEELSEQSLENLSEQAVEDVSKNVGEGRLGHGDLFVAEFQTAGRGRLGRKWLAPAGSNITMSLLLNPDFAPQYAPMLTLVMGLSVAQAVEKLWEDNKENDYANGNMTGREKKCAIKWPNDVVISGKKICGILTEMSLEGTSIREVVIGVGINVNLSQVDHVIKDVATSLYLETGRTYDRNHIVNLVLQQFEMNYEKYLQTLDLTYLVEDYNNLLINKDKQVRVLDSLEPFEGIARGINVNGELLVECCDGEIEAVGAGEVSVRGMYGYV